MAKTKKMVNATVEELREICNAACLLLEYALTFDEIFAIKDMLDRANSLTLSKLNAELEKKQHEKKH